MAKMLRAGDAGVAIRLTVQGTGDFAGATAVMKIQLPSGGTVNKPATITGRTVEYVTTTTDFPEGGTAQVQGKITLADGQCRHTGKASFQVEGTL